MLNLIGMESEIRVLFDDQTGSNGGSGAADAVLAAARDHYASICGREAGTPCTNLDCEVGLFLPNGARLYIDHGYLEYSTPECSSTTDAVAAVRAGDRIVRLAAEKAGEAPAAARRIAAFRNNRDYAPEAHSCGAHINVRMSRAGFERVFGDQKTLHGFVIPFFVCLPVLCGAGSIADLGAGEEEFVIWQRAPFLKDLVALRTVTDRPLVNTRNESLDADAERYARFHIIAFDANVAEVAEFLKLGLLRLLCAAIDAGRADVTLELADPMRAIRSVSRNPLGVLSLASERTIAPLELLQTYLAAFERMRQDGAFDGRVPDAAQVLSLCSEVLARLERDPLELVGVLDWPTKFAWLERVRERHGLAWSDPLLKWLDVRYHALTGGQGPPADLRRITSDEEIRRLVAHSPRGSRAAVRALLIRRFGDEIAAADWPLVIGRRDDTIYILPDDPRPGVVSELEAAGALADAAHVLGLRPLEIDLGDRSSCAEAEANERQANGPATKA